MRGRRERVKGMQNSGKRTLYNFRVPFQPFRATETHQYSVKKNGYFKLLNKKKMEFGIFFL